MVGFFSEGAELVSLAPFLGRGTRKGQSQIREFALEHLGKGIRVDLTKKQVARNGVAWTVRAYRGDDPADWVDGVAEARFREGKVESLHLSAG